MQAELIEELAPAFTGLATDEGDIEGIMRNSLPTGLVSLTAEEIELIARRILELQSLAAQNALVAEPQYMDDAELRRRGL